MTPAHAQLDAAERTPRVIRLWRVIAGMRSPVRFMMSGAHPDDEAAGLMAALGFRDGVNLSYVCSTRGEGGQNDLGAERGATLGALRTAEMESASERLAMRMYWLSDCPTDPISDWRFSKSGSETLGVWGHQRSLARLVHVLRRERPDCLCPTFLDVPGQHGHHRAMTRLAIEAWDAAADPDFAGCDLAPWSVAKLYLPAWSGAGRAYDDDDPPPPATVVVSGAGGDALTGWSFAEIGAMSHGHHRSQGMGHWPVTSRDYPLHLLLSRVGDDGGDLRDHLPKTWADLGLPVLDDLIAALDPARPERVAAGVPAILDVIARAECPPDHQHRLDLLRRQTHGALALCQDVPTPSLAPTALRPGETVSISVPVALPEGWVRTGENIGPTDSARIDDGYRDSFDPLDPPLPAMQVGEARIPLPAAITAAPARSLCVRTPRLALNLLSEARTVTLRADGITPAGATLGVENLPAGWRAEPQDGAMTLTPPVDAPEQQHRLVLTLDHRPATHLAPISYPHIRPTQIATTAEVTVSILRAQLPQGPIGYIGAGLDTVADRLADLGVQVVDVSGAGPAAPELAELRSLIVGIHAYRFNPALAADPQALHPWVEAGGKLVTLYHRPWDNWEAGSTPPRRIQIGQPSLRWRVTHKDAPVSVTQPDDPLFTTPHQISAADFDGWDKERGLYFAQDWASDYRSLLSMSDPGDPPLAGGLLVAQVGRGAHVHCALNLHHQLEHGVPGAIRLLLNACAPV